MALVLPDGYALVTLKFRMGAAAHEALVVFGAVNGAGSVQTDAVDWANNVQQNLLPFMGDSTVFESASLIAREATDYLTGYWAINDNGGKAEQSLPPNCALLVKKITGVMGRANQGRMYLPGCLDTDTSNSGILDSDYAAEVQAGLDAFLTSTEPMYIFHRDPLNPSDYDHAPPTLVNVLALQATIATQRRRLR